jgi:hypothetical protein
MSFSAVSPPPMRGYIVHWWGQCARPLEIVGVVVKTITRRSCGDSWEETTILPVVYDIDFVDEPSGGLCVVDPTEGYWSDCVYKVLWCYWPEAEDQARIHATLDEFLEREQAAHQEASEGRPPLPD